MTKSKTIADISRYIEYFRKIVAEHKDINGFYMMDIIEILDGLRSTVKYPALILENISGSHMASNLDNPLEVINSGFPIIDHLPKTGYFHGEMVLINRMKQVGHQVITRMLQVLFGAINFLYKKSVCNFFSYF